MKFSKYLQIMKINLLNKLAYPWEVIGSVIFLGVIFFIYTNLWTTIYADKTSMYGFSLPAIVWFLLFTEVLIAAGRVELIQGISREIKTGEIAYHFLRPVNYVVLKLCTAIGESMFSVPSILISGGTLIFTLVGWFNPQPQYLILSTIPLILGILLNIFFVIAMSLLTFWIEEAQSLRFIQLKLALFLGGGIIPLDFFPVWFKKIMELTPFPTMTYLPAKTIVAFSWDLFTKTIVLELFWISVISVFIYLTYKSGSRVVKIHGG